MRRSNQYSIFNKNRYSVREEREEGKNEERRR